MHNEGREAPDASLQALPPIGFEGCFCGPGKVGKESRSVQLELLGDIGLNLREMDRPALGCGRLAQATKVTVSGPGVLQFGSFVSDVGWTGRARGDFRDELGDIYRHAMPARRFERVRSNLPLPVRTTYVVGGIADIRRVIGKSTHDETELDLFAIHFLDVPENGFGSPTPRAIRISVLDNVYGRPLGYRLLLN